MMAKMAAKTRIPTTINAISVDRDNSKAQAVAADFGQKVSRLADAYVKIDARPAFTCATHLLEDPPSEGESIGWSESNAVIYANSLLGAAFGTTSAAPMLHVRGPTQKVISHSH
jgi:predicted aconitase